MVNMLSNLHVVGHILNRPNLSQTDNGTQKTKLYIKVKQDKLRKDENDTYKYTQEHTTLPFDAYGSTAKYIFDYLIKGQKVLIEYTIDSKRKSEENAYPHPYFVINSIQGLESPEIVKERMARFEREKENREDERERSNGTAGHGEATEYANESERKFTMTYEEAVADDLPADSESEGDYAF